MRGTLGGTSCFGFWGSKGDAVSTFLLSSSRKCAGGRAQAIIYAIDLTARQSLLAPTISCEAETIIDWQT